MSNDDEDYAGFPDLIEQGSLGGWAGFLCIVGLLAWVML